MRCRHNCTSVLSRAIERLVVKQFIYPALLTPPPSLVFSDQFAFRPSGSTTANVIAILQTVTNLLSDHLHVIVSSLDFSKVFDTVRHTTLLQKFAQIGHSWCCLQLAGGLFHQSLTLHEVRWLDFLTVSDLGQHCTGLSDWTSVVCRQRFRSEHSRCAELDHIQHWAKVNNLTLNRQKSKEIIVTLSRRSKRAFNLPPCLSVTSSEWRHSKYSASPSQISSPWVNMSEMSS